MEPIDLATQWPFTNVDLTEAVNITPNNYGRVRELNVYGEPKFLGTTFVEIQINEGVLSLIPAKERGAPATILDGKRPKSIVFKIPHFPLTRTITAADIQNRMRPGTRVPQTVEIVTDEKLVDIRNAHSITLEWLRMGGLKGVILDADGTELYDLYDEFGITKKTINFALNNDATDVLEKCRELNRHIEDNLKGEVMTGDPRCLVSGEFFDALIKHPKVLDFYKNWQAAAAITGQNPRKGFSFGNVMFEEYRATATKPNGATQRFIDAKKGHAFPEGTMNTFETNFAPADTVNTANLPPDAEIFISQELMDHGKGIELYSESDPLPLCKRPALLVEVSTP